MSKRTILMGCLVAAGAAIGLIAGCSSEPDQPLAPKYKTSIDPKELRNSAFEKEFPQQYATYLRNNESEIMTEYKGSVPYHKNDNVNPLPKGFKHAQPYLKNLWAGYPFMFEYNEARGHTYAIHDILEIDRINQYDEKAGLPATCWNCKTAKIPTWVEQYGDKFWATNFNEFRTKDKIDMNDNTIGCANCHNPADMTLTINSVPLRDWLVASRGPDWEKNVTRNEMRSLVCAQCHVEYYFSDDNKKPIFPWANGKNPEDMYEYYKKVGKTVKEPGFEGNFADWTHPVSKTPMLKAQHPDYEMFQDGTHGAAGVACADCHMPFIRMDGKKKVSSHHWQSPLKSPEGIDQACRQCHADKSVEYLKGRVEYTQKRAFENLLVAQERSVKAHEAVRLANEWTGEKSADYTKLMFQAKDMVRKGQFFWDYVSAENSVGFHNPAKTMSTLQKSMEYSQAAIDFAMQATNYGIGPNLAGDIKEIVPPILEWSRTMQMEKEMYVNTNPWIKYLPTLPKQERMWKLQEKIR